VTSQFDNPADAPATDDQARLDRIRAALTDAGYTVDGVEALIGPDAAAALHRDLLVPASVALARDADKNPPLAALVRLFLLAEPVPAADLPAADDLAAAGILEAPDAAGRVACRFDIRPYAVASGDDTVDLFVASDLGGLQVPADQPLRRDHVVGIGPATTNLAQLTPRQPVARALDLGVGMGVQTMHLLQHVDFVVATDISARAIEFARFNLLLNAPALGLDAADLDARVSLRVGDLLDPVAGEEFDLVVTNPPFVITPRRDGEGASDQYTYRDGGRPGDRLVEELIRGLGAHLAPGGIAVMLGNWEVHEGDATWHTRLESWPDAATDLWVVERERAEPIDYADMWLKDAAENRELESWRDQFARYLDDFASRAVESVGMGQLLLHRPAEAAAGHDAVRRFEVLPHQLEQPLGARIRDTFDADDWLRERDDADLADETFLVAPDVTEERWTLPGNPDPSAILLRQGGGFRRTFPESTELSSFVSVCDGDLTARQILVAIAALLEVDEAELLTSVLADVRELVALGFLVPAWT
jgi:methylase of polypeptide subunit release factors